MITPIVVVNIDAVSDNLMKITMSDGNTVAQSLQLLKY